MIAAALLVLAAAAADTRVRYDACVALVDTAPDRALVEAVAWRVAGGGVPARACEALSYVAQRRFDVAADAFAAAAREAERTRGAQAATLWVQAGNAALAGGRAQPAVAAFDTALARGTLAGTELGEAHLDRARARLALGQAASARADLDEALRLAPADPLGWLLSARTAREGGDLPRAQADIAQALQRSPDDATVALEAGDIAAAAGASDAARTAWAAAIRNRADSDAGRAARARLQRLDTTRR